MAFTNLPAEEVERRRLLSLEVMKERERTRFERWYQQRCDSFYWKNGKCCAGCDWWSSEQGDIGECHASAPVAGDQVIKSLLGEGGFCSYIPAPGQPYTRNHHVCGEFKDDFDWVSLDEEYRAAIGVRDEKPAHQIAKYRQVD